MAAPAPRPVRRIRLPPIDWTNVVGINAVVPVKVDWPELRLTDAQIVANGLAQEFGYERPHPDHAIIEVEIPRSRPQGAPMSIPEPVIGNPVAPTIGQIVTYETDRRNGLAYTLPAIVTCTRDSHPGDYPDGRKNPLPVPSSEHHVHLTVFSPGGFGTVVGARDETSALGVSIIDEPESGDFPDALSMLPGSGTYVELDVPFDTTQERQPRSWRWPTRT